jgi:hypothetical protein
MFDYPGTIDVMFVGAMVTSLIAKIILFFRYKHESWEMHNLFYFSHCDIVRTRDYKKKKITKFQNFLSYLGALQIVVYVVFKSLFS